MLRFVFLLSLYVCLSVGADAHSIGRSSSLWKQEGSNVSGEWNISGEEAEQLVQNGARNNQELAAAIARYAEKAIIVQNGEMNCGLKVQNTRRKFNGDIVVQFLAENCVVNQISFKPLFAEAPSHVHLLHAEDNEQLLTRSSPVAFIGAEAGITESASPVQYAGLGVFHILEGFDHLAFLLALLIAVRTVKALFWCVTGFTLGHSFTLILGSLGVLNPLPSVVEPLIAFTIAFTVIERALHASDNPQKLLAASLGFVGILALADYMLFGTLPLLVWAGIGLLCYCVWGAASEKQDNEPRYMLPIVTLGFGLLHGFGFYGVLSEIGLPKSDTVLALLGFNIGVEIGQLIFLSAALGVVWLVDKWMKQSRPMLETAVSVCLVAVSMFWFAERVYLG